MSKIVSVDNLLLACDFLVDKLWTTFLLGTFSGVALASSRAYLLVNCTQTTIKNIQFLRQISIHILYHKCPTKAIVVPKFVRILGNFLQFFCHLLPIKRGGLCKRFWWLATFFLDGKAVGNAGLLRHKMQNVYRFGNTKLPTLARAHAQMSKYLLTLVAF